MSITSTTTMITSATPGDPYVVENCRDLVKLMSDGTVIRSRGPFPFLPVQSHEATYPTIVWEDHKFDPVHDLHLRLYKPGSSDLKPTTIILYIHGGGFCLGSRAMPSSQNLCLRLADELRAVVVSVDYRLAPEDRLPAAVEDCWTALMWVKKNVCSDGQGVFLFGDSAGGNIAHHLTVQAVSGGSGELDPVRIKGCVLLAPAFGGCEPTKSELEGPTQTFLSFEDANRYGRLALPIGETADHPLFNPFGPRSANLELLNLAPMLVMVGDKDILRDRIKDYASRLNGWGKKVDYVEFEGLAHGFLVTSTDREPADKVVNLTKTFISDYSV